MNTHEGKGNQPPAVRPRLPDSRSIHHDDTTDGSAVVYVDGLGKVTVTGPIQRYILGRGKEYRRGLVSTWLPCLGGHKDVQRFVSFDAFQVLEEMKRVQDM